MKIEEIKEKSMWEDFLREYSPYNYFQSWSWGEVRKKLQKRIWRFGLYDEGQLKGIFQVEYVQAKRGRFLHVRHGPVVASWNDRSFSFITLYLKTMGKRLNVWFIRISLLIENNEKNRKYVIKNNYKDAPITSMDGEYCWVLDLDKSEEEIFREMRKTTRNLIRKADKIGVKIVKSNKVSDIKSFLKLYKLTAKRHSFIMHQGLKEEFAIFANENQALLFEGYYHGELMASALFTYYADQAIYRHSASIQQKIPVNYLLQWEAIKEAKKRGKKIYNLWGIANEENKRHPWKGHSLFKKGFGGRVVSYLHAQDLPLSGLYSVTFLIETLRRLRKGY